MTPTSTTAAQPQSILEYDLPCVRCGYNLRTLSAAGRCPECGLAVALTASLGGELAHTRPSYVRRLAWACGILLAARAVAFAGALLPFLSRHDTGAITFSGFAAASLLCLVGSWLLTAREHPHLPLEVAHAAIAIRLLSLVAFILFTPYLGAELLRELGAWRWVPVWLSAHRRAWDYAGMAGSILYLLYPAMEMHIMVRLSRRLADTALRQRALVTGIATTAAGLAVALIVLIMTWFPGLQESAWSQPLGYACAAMICVLLLGWLWTAWNCLLAARIFAKASRHAACRWEHVDREKAEPVQDVR